MDVEKKKEILNLVFISLNLIVLSFFVFLFSISIFDKRRIKEAYVSILTAFRIVEGGGNPSPVLGGEMRTIPWEPIVDADPYFGKLVKVLGEQEGIGIYRFGKYYIISMETKALFAPNSYSLSRRGKVILSKIADYVKKMNVYLEVAGHTDNIPPKGMSNWELSALRALVVRRFLISKGLEKDRIFAYGFGDARPISPNNTPQGRMKNRRVDLIIVKEKQKKAATKSVRYEEFEFSL